MKTLHLVIIIISITFVSVIVSTQLVNADCNYCWITVENKTTAMRISIQSDPTSLNIVQPQDRQIHIRFFDATTNNMIKNVTFGMKIIKGSKTLLYETNFYSKSGSFTLNLKPSERYLWSANPDHDPIDGLYYSQGDQIDIQTSYLTNDVYNFMIQPLMYVSEYQGQQKDKGVEFETGLNLLVAFNKTIIPNLNESNKITIESPANQFRSGIIAQDVICKEGLQLIIKTEDGSPQCVGIASQSKLISRGWAEVPSQSALRLWPEDCSSSYSTGNTVCLEVSKPIKSPVNFNMTTILHGYSNTVSILHSHAFCAILSHDKIKFDFNSTLPINFTLYADDVNMPDQSIGCTKNGNMFMGFENTMHYSNELDAQEKRLFTFVFDVDKPTLANVNFTYSKIPD